MAEPGDDLIQNESELRLLTKAIAALREVVRDASAGLQVRMGRDTERLTDKLDENIASLVKSLDQASAAAKDATTASNRYAGQLVWATLALVVVTVGLAAVPVVERFYPPETAQQRECSEFAA